MTEEMTVEVVIEPEDTASAVVRVPADDLSTLLFARRQQGRVVVEFDPDLGCAHVREDGWIGWSGRLATVVRCALISAGFAKATDAFTHEGLEKLAAAEAFFGISDEATPPQGHA